MRLFFDACSRLPSGDVVEPLPFDELEQGIRHTKASSPDADGLPDEVWALCGRDGVRVIHALYLHITEGAQLPTDFNESLFVFIPKASVAGMPLRAMRLPARLAFGPYR